MSSILYYSKYCEVSKKYLQLLSKSPVQKDVHFICIDKRVKDSNNKTYIILENGQKIILPDNVTRVPALLLLNKGYNIIYGDQILEHLRPQQEVEVRQATQNNMEPMSFSLGGGSGFGDIVSDQYSFLDQDPSDLEAKGNGGLRQQGENNDNSNTTIRGSKKMNEDSSNQEMEIRMKKMKEERDFDLKKLTGNKPPMSF
jgi:hypothetical protein